MPTSFAHSASYFNKIESTNSQLLRQVDQLDSVQEVNYCLHNCLKQWINPNAQFRAKGDKCRHVAVTQDTPKNGAPTVSHRINVLFIIIKLTYL